MKQSGNKAVIWLRVSTVRQELDSQREDLVRLAREDGYSKSRLIYIEGRGVSARTQNEKYIREFEHLKEVIREDPSITTVYAWEVSRLARIQSKLHELQEFLVERKIQLVIVEPKIRLLKEDGTVDSGEELKLSVLATLAKQEMEIKLSRSKRGRERNRKEGKFNGGAFGPLYGYTTNESNYIIPDPKEVELVNLIFTLYSSGKYSIKSLALELRQRGYTLRDRKITDSNINNILRNEYYIGKTGKTGRTYTQIIETKLWNKALKVRKQQTLEITKTKEYRHLHLATKLLRCGCCGYGYTPGKDKYVCYKHSLGHRFSPEDQCKESVGVNIEIVDGIFWSVSKEQDIISRKTQDKTRIPELKKDMKVLSQKMQELHNTRNKDYDKKERVIEDYEDGLISKDKRNQKLQNIQEEINDIEVQITNLRRKYNVLRFDLLRHVKGFQDTSLPPYKTYSQEQKRELVEKYILGGKVDPVVVDGRKAVKITLQLVRGGEVIYLYFYTLKNRDKQLKRL